MMNDGDNSELNRFALGPSAADRWMAARELMAARKLLDVVDTDAFDSGLAGTGETAKNGQGIERLIAVDLLMRLGGFVKKIAPKIERTLSGALQTQIPPLGLLEDSNRLPEGAKSAELRENIASALRHAGGDWVLPYTLEALLCEDRSQRCRIELAGRLVERENNIDNWFVSITNLPVKRLVGPPGSTTQSAARVAGISEALRKAVSENRSHLIVTSQSGPGLAKLVRAFIQISQSQAIPKGLDKTAASLADLLDEVLSVKLTLIVEPDMFGVLELFERWWRPLPYPPSLLARLAPVSEKIATAITFRARWGHRSTDLAIRLRQSYADQNTAARRLREIAQGEQGLEPSIEDWLRGRRMRRTDGGGAAEAFTAAANEDLTEAIAFLLLDTIAAQGERETLSDAMPADYIRRLVQGVEALARRRRLEVVGEEGEVVEFHPLEHRMLSGAAPRRSDVKILRPLVARRRHDGSRDVVVQAIVDDAQ